MSAIKLILGIVLIGSVFSRNVETRLPFMQSGFFEGPGVPIQAPSGHITGGTEAAPNEFPWQTVIYSQKGANSYICGGVLIANNYVLTAAHCTQGVDEVEVVMGVHDRNGIEASQVSKIVSPGSWQEHEEYNSRSLQNDIALIKISPPVKFNDQIRAIPLNKVEPPPKTMVTLTGWGRTGDGVTEGTSSVLLKTDVLTAMDNLCKSYYGIQNMDGVVCLNTDYSESFTSSCGGDSGGPMNYDGPDGMVVNGITSFGSRGGCEKGYPIGYTSVPFFYDWIIENTGIKA